MLAASDQALQQRIAEFQESLRQLVTEKDTRVQAEFSR
jgi:phosphoribosylcarboxyaminoimidazole (NCAIR) mutase